MAELESDRFSNYVGSTALSFICDRTGLPLDMVNFIFCQVVALFLSYFMRKQVKGAESRLWYTVVCGVSICSFCFGRQVFHIIISGGISYLIMSSTKSRYMPWLVFTCMMGYLSFLHIQRQFFSDASYALDITGPFMVLTQKVTSLAFSVMDGTDAKKEGHQLTPLQKLRVVYELPRPLVFCSFLFQFQSMLAGPLVFYDDFTEFIYDPVKEEESNPALDVFIKMVKSIFFAMIFLSFGAQVDVQYLRDEEFLKVNSIFYIVAYILVSTTVERCKYYHAWLLADGVCNLSGLGYDRSKGTWDKVSNVHAFRLELSLNMKELLDNWNIQTMKWLRYVIYERSPAHLRTNLVYIVSAFWHGFYPGYYITFLSGALFTTAGRVVRRHLRPYFLENKHMKRSYDIFTWFFTRVLLAYITFSFVLEDFYPSVAVYIRLYCYLHICALIAIYVLPVVGKKASGDPRVTQSRDSIGNGIHATKNGTLGEKGSKSEEVRTLLIDSHEAANSAKLKTG